MTKKSPGNDSTPVSLTKHAFLTKLYFSYVGAFFDRLEALPVSITSDLISPSVISRTSRRLDSTPLHRLDVTSQYQSQENGSSEGWD